MEVRLFNRSNQTTIDWQSIDNTVESGQFSGGVTASGGWYNLELRAVSSNGTPLGTTLVERIGVGEVFLVAGHSVAQGDENPIEAASDDRVNHIQQPLSQIYESTADPQYLTNPPYAQLGEGARIGPFGHSAHFWGAFGQHLAQRLNVPVLIFNAAFGGTSLEHWAKSSQGQWFEHGFVRWDIRMPYINVKNTLTKYIRDIGVRGILSDQGQNDHANTNVDEVLQYYRTWVNQARVDLNYGALAVMVNRQTPYITTDPRWAIRQAQNRMAAEPNCFPGPDYDTGLEPQHRPDQVHLNDEGKRRAAQLWADAVTNTGFLNTSQPWQPGYTSTAAVPGTPTPPNPTGTAAPEGFVEMVSCERVTGWAADRSRPNVSVSVEVYVNGQLAGTVVADRPRADVGAYLNDNGLHGYEFVIPAPFRRNGNQTIQVRYSGSSRELSNSGQTVGGCTAPATDSPVTPSPAPAPSATDNYRQPEGFLDNGFCDRVTGWAADRSQPNVSVSVDVYVNGQLAGTVRADKIRSDVGAYLNDNGLHGYEFVIPNAYRRAGNQQIQVRFSGSSRELSNSGQTVGGCQAPPSEATPTPTPTPTPVPAPTGDYQRPEGFLDIASCERVTGWAADRSRPNVSISVEVYVNGQLAGTVVADRPRADVGAYLNDNGLHGYEFVIPAPFRRNSNQTIQVRYSGSSRELSNSGQTVGGCTAPATDSPVTPSPAPTPAAYQQPEGHLDHASCDRITGWAADRAKPNTSIGVDLYIDGQLAGTLTADKLRTDVGAYLNDNGLHGFEFAIPSVYKTSGQHTVVARFAGSAQLFTMSTRQYTCANGGRLASKEKGRTGTAEISDFRIFPNPVEKELTLAIPAGYQPGQLSFSVTNSSGQVMGPVTTPGFLDQSATLSVGSTAPGIYFLRISQAGRLLKVLRFVKK
ncbi:sialate O-acetylesterase [Tellurirhabdus rosea]|uniref:sialate O-acetylesterase n=1 Tax=Tellurirhabdus rosea TaxID=2674997 RepID=UPI00225205A9|nr:sialate O-acetylesterase [Tellurirhabdus rosea]